MAEVKMPLIGDKVPEFEAQTTKGWINFPQGYAGKWVVLFSHPADFTPVCTTEFVAFAKRHDKFKELNTELLGLSIDPKGTIRAMLYYPLSNGRNMDEILRLLKALQTTDKHKVATPAGWPENELIGKNVIIPPPVSEKEIEERKDKYNCYDWWFCYKAI